MTTYAVPGHLNHVLSGSHACKRASLDSDGKPYIDRDGSPSWTHERRGDLVIDGEAVHEDSSQADPFELWAAIRHSRKANA